VFLVSHDAKKKKKMEEKKGSLKVIIISRGKDLMRRIL
jgi:hypothetical protein